MYRITLGLVLYLAVSANAVFKNCGSDVGSYNTVIVSDCDPNANLCIAKRGKNMSIEINFNLEKDVKNVSAIVHGIIENIIVPYPIPNSDACQSSGLTCPMTKDDGPYRYKANLPVVKQFARFKVDVKWELKDENNNNIVCVVIPTQVK